MKPQQLATLLNISPATLRRWAGADYGEFLSVKGRGVNGGYRSFDDQDARILAWVAILRAQNVSTEDIYLTLKSAQASNWRGLPALPGGMANDEPIAVVPREAVEERVHALQERYELQLQVIVKERDQLRQQLEATQEEIKVARQETIAAQKESAQAIQQVQREKAEALEKLQQRMNELSTKEAELRGRLEQYTFGGRRWNAGSLIIVALLAGVVLALVIVVLFAGR
jgi:DNA-binding transcriptional MerR regulator